MPDVAVGEPVADTVQADAFLTGITALLPEIRARAGETERAGRVSDDMVKALANAGVFRAVQPTQWGGLELDLATFYQGMALIASACGSTGWVASVVGIHPWQIALFAEEAQRDLWQEDPDVRASSSYAPTGSVRRVDGGFHLSGRWHFSSGVDHCGWVLLGGVIPDEGSGVEFRTFLVPRQEFAIDHESWRVTGLAGTGSKDIIVAGAFVPEYRTHSIIDVYHERNPGFAVNDRPYYRLPWRLVFGYTIAAPAVGAALGAVQAFIESNSARVSAYGGPAVARDPAVHRPLARALITTDRARTSLTATWVELQSLLREGKAISYPRRAQAFYEATLAHHSCTDAICDLLAVNGGRTMRADGALQRFFRDLLAMRNHPAANLEFSGSLYAQAMLGLDPPPFDPSHRFVL
ncbi:MAG TPA: acyl-CoA dehydrogenase family protein [Acetobacteraceae bacterium]|jgi:3-hydroxy-9,10-secoandrosta-1,3,5(10)-triene-9,17-dione monooxygenase|nr:acyl-CoA dehydrogenase family protein [Acetobacteraceae bacterium]